MNDSRSSQPLIASLPPGFQAAALKRELKLHLGCGSVHLNDFLNVDADPDSRADLTLNFLEIDRAVPDGSVSEVQMHHALNYLTLWEARRLFVKLFRLFRPGGKLSIETVNLLVLVDLISEQRGHLMGYLEGIRALHALGWENFENEKPYQPNAFSWTPWHLAAELELAGFIDVTFMEPQTHAKWRDMRFEAIKPKLF